MKIRSDAEGVELDGSALEMLSDIGSTSSLRYVVQLLTPAKLMAHINGREFVTESDIKECSELFIDAKTSAKQLKIEKNGTKA